MEKKPQGEAEQWELRVCVADVRVRGVKKKRETNLRGAEQWSRLRRRF